WVQLVFQRLRLGQMTLERKVDVLGRPLRCDGDAYLPGYLLVRQLWLAAIRRDGRLANETDLFLMYLRSFLYDDMELVATLLDETLDEIRGPSAVANHIMRRLEQFTNLDSHHVTLFDEAVAEKKSPELRQNRVLTTLALDELGIQRGEARLREALAEYERIGTGDIDNVLLFHETQVLL